MNSGFSSRTATRTDRFFPYGINRKNGIWSFRGNGGTNTPISIAILIILPVTFLLVTLLWVESNFSPILFLATMTIAFILWVMLARIANFGQWSRYEIKLNTNNQSITAYDHKDKKELWTEIFEIDCLRIAKMPYAAHYFLRFMPVLIYGDTIQEIVVDCPPTPQQTIMAIARNIDKLEFVISMIREELGKH